MLKAAVLFLVCACGMASTYSLATALHLGGLDVDAFELAALPDQPHFAVAVSRARKSSTRVALALLVQPSYRQVALLHAITLDFDPGLCRRDLALRLSPNVRHPDVVDICISGHTFCQACLATKTLICEPL